MLGRVDAEEVGLEAFRRERARSCRSCVAILHHGSGRRMRAGIVDAPCGVADGANVKLDVVQVWEKYGHPR